MKLAATALFVYSLLVLGGGVFAYVAVRSAASLVFAAILTVAFLSLGCLAFRGTLTAGYLGGGLTFLQAIYFAYRFIATERFIPSGVLLIISFIVLLAVMLGVFLGLQRASDKC